VGVTKRHSERSHIHTHTHTHTVIIFFTACIKALGLFVELNFKWSNIAGSYICNFGVVL
jgi:hypothetical protein